MNEKLIKKDTNRTVIEKALQSLGDIITDREETMKLLKEKNNIDDAAKNSLINDMYTDMFLDTNEIPKIDDVVDIAIASDIHTQYGMSKSECYSYIMNYMMIEKNICHMFGRVAYDCQEILIKDLFLDDTLLLGE